MTKLDFPETHDRYPLAAYHGKKPDAPEWFRNAVATPYSEHSVEVDGAKVSYQKWGRSDKPGLLLVHGNGAHANWYDFIAPAFTSQFNVVAMTFCGMGNSEWREAYSLEQFSAEQIGVMQDADFFDHETKPTIIAHSFGGIISIYTASVMGSALEAAIIMDTPIFAPDYTRKPPTPRPRATGAQYPDLAAALGRFRLMPPQPCENHYILDHIARHSLKQVDEKDSSAWAWKFDPTLWQKIESSDEGHWDMLPTLRCKLAFMRGERSDLVPESIMEGMLSQVQVPFLSIKDAHHHLFLDNPLGTIEGLKRILAAWDDAAG